MAALPCVFCWGWQGRCGSTVMRFLLGMAGTLGVQPLGVPTLPGAGVPSPEDRVSREAPPEGRDLLRRLLAICLLLLVMMMPA